MGSNGKDILTGGCVKVVQTVVHAAVFDVKYGAVGGRGPGLCTVVNPGTETFGNFQCGFVAGVFVNINDTLQDFVHGVPWHPGLVHDVG